MVHIWIPVIWLALLGWRWLVDGPLAKNPFLSFRWIGLGGWSRDLLGVAPIRARIKAISQVWGFPNKVGSL